MRRILWLPVPLLSFACSLGCGGTPPPPAAAKPPEVVVCLPSSQRITDYEYFTGRAQAVGTVEVRARVTGYLDKALFKDGAEIQKGDLLFEIDPRTYQADLDKAEANVVQAEVHLRRLESDSERASRLMPTRAISREEYDKMVGDRNEAEAALRSARATRDLARLNLDFTRVTAPINGRISRRSIDPGNMVKADETTLTSIVGLDPIYAYFDVDERTLLRLRRLLQEGKIPSSRQTKVSVCLGLADEQEFPHEGTIDFADNHVDPQTGTLQVRGLFPNPYRIISPGMFVRVRLPVGSPHEAILIPERALGTDQGRKFLYLVNDQDEVVYRPVKIGSLNGGNRVIEDGLSAGEKVIVSGLQRVRPGVKVEPKSEIPNPKSEGNSKSE